MPKMVKRTYKLIPSPPPPMLWDRYEGLVIKKWRDLLRSPASLDENNLQKFLEEHPCMLPGAFGLPLPSGHYPFPCAVISQPPLQGLGTKVPDFMWLATNSSYLHPVLIEIETPDKGWFTKKGIQHADLTQALDQLAAWKTWFNKVENQALFLEYYQIPPDIRRWRTFHPLYILIYGSREEFEEKPDLNAKRGQLERPDEFHMTFDRLSSVHDVQDMMCVRKTGSYYEAMTIPPTFRLGPMWAEYRLYIRNKEDAVKRNLLITKERKEFLLDRLPYWDDWAKSKSKGRWIVGGAE
ncbi:MAG: Shedu immune nuclease family protein [Dehalococcoidia bacterium]